MDSIYLEYIPELKDYQEAYSFYDSKSTIRKLDKLVAVFLMIFGIGLLFIIKRHGVSIMYLVLAIIFIVVGFIDFFRIVDPIKMIVSSRFKKDHKFMQLQKLTFTDDGIEYETNDVKSNIAWNYYRNYYESVNIFMLIYGNKLFEYSIIPKDKFDPETLVNFRKLLDKKIKL
ncbi:MAG: YcxB family protein [Fusobacteriaceae bacterium]|jgi:hypothetical protein|nr:YcxB family protein [Fusobacteriaceae bacterium]